MSKSGSKHSFNIALFTGCFLVSFIIIGLTGIFPIDSKMILIIIGFTLVGVTLSFIVRKIEKIEDKW